MILFESEKEFEDMLCDHLDQECWIVEDEECPFYDRQTNLGKYGITDLILYNYDLDLDDDKKEIITDEYLKIVELKITELSASHLSQIARYKTFFDNTDHKYDISYVLVCKESKNYSGDLVFLAQSIEWLDIYVYSFSLDSGIEFKRITGWTMTDSEDNNTSSIKALSNKIDTYQNKDVKNEE